MYRIEHDFYTPGYEVHTPMDRLASLAWAGPPVGWDSRPDGGANLPNKSSTLPSSEMLQIMLARTVSSPWPVDYGLGSLSEVINTCRKMVTQIYWALGFFQRVLLPQTYASLSSLASMPDHARETHEESTKSQVKGGFAPSAPSAQPELGDGEMHRTPQRSPLPSQKTSSRFLGASNRAATQSSDTKPRHKRSRGDGNHGDFEDEKDHSSDENDDPTGRLPGERSEVSDPAFACPFFRRFPMRHMDCMNRKLTRIRDVKQHVQRRHSQAFPCPVCYESFPSPLRRDDHIRSRCCEPAAYPRTNSPDGVSPEAQERLKFRVSRTLSRAEKWFTVWDIIFKNEPRPSNPYVGTVVEETIGMIRDFWKLEGPQIVPAFLESLQTRATDDSNLVSLLMHLLDEVKVRFEQRTRELDSVASPENGTGSRQHPTPAYSEPLSSSGTLVASPPLANDHSYVGFQPYIFQSGTETPPVELQYSLSNTAASETDGLDWGHEPQPVGSADLSPRQLYNHALPAEILQDLCREEFNGDLWTSLVDNT